MTHDEIVQLLQVISAYDSRKIDGPTVAAWKESALRGRWRRESAFEAVHTHFAKSTAWLMPGHVSELIRAGNRHPAPAAEVLAVERGAPASEETRTRLMAEIRKLADSKAVK